MAAILYSIILKVDGETLERIKAYCQEHELKLTINSRNSTDVPYWIVVWGTKRELKEFGQYF